MVRARAAVGGAGLDGDVVGARGEVVPAPAPYGVLVAPGHDRVDQAVAAAVREVVAVEAEPAEIRT
ncbi:hypothetical protein HEK616_55380 [Streptomyces nigrescens]|uniref:Uncharacterized protein n=1 Tax=Streptomyces nigrescens TaxID=1920 RepID=A0ABM8A0B0_STRNI|nr:hypothetical protein HEK616_55380 [Streptomyces nigrescens]